jgi:hypothetical protein
MLIPMTKTELASSRTQIWVKVEFVLDREGIVVTKFLHQPMQGFGLEANSMLGGCSVASFTIARSRSLDGTKRRDLVSFCLANRTNSKRFVGGDEVLVENVEACSMLRE